MPGEIHTSKNSYSPVSSAAQLQAEIRALEHFSFRQNQATYDSYDALSDAMEEMTDEELREVIQESSDTIDSNKGGKENEDAQKVLEAAKEEHENREEDALNLRAPLGSQDFPAEFTASNIIMTPSNFA